MCTLELTQSRSGCDARRKKWHGNFIEQSLTFYQAEVEKKNPVCAAERRIQRQQNSIFNMLLNLTSILKQFHSLILNRKERANRKNTQTHTHWLELEFSLLFLFVAYEK